MAQEEEGGTNGEPARVSYTCLSRADINRVETEFHSCSEIFFSVLSPDSVDLIL